MNLQTMEVLQFGLVKEQIASFTVSEFGKEASLALKPSTNKKQIEAWLNEVTEAKRVLEISSSVPIHGLKGMQTILDGLNKGIALRPDQFTVLQDLLPCVRRLKRFMKDKEYAAP
ncbi:MAG: endonuclease MutS2, partial [Tuberibacillus sp.]